MDNPLNKPDIKQATNQQLEPFIILARTAKGASLRALVEQAIEANGLYVFGELLQLQCIQEMENNADNTNHFKLLTVFAYGTFKDYMTMAGNLPPLSNLMKKKLKLLTIVSMAAKSKYINYNTLIDELNISGTRELEDLLISAIYAGIIHGRLDQQNTRFEVDWTIGRDLTPDDMNYIVNTLSSWCTRCESMLQSIEGQVRNASKYLNEDTAKKSQIATEVENIMSTIKKASSQELDYMSTSELRTNHPSPSAGVEVKPKKSKVKGLRGSTMKLWSKN